MEVVGILDSIDCLITAMAMIKTSPVGSVEDVHLNGRYFSSNDSKLNRAAEKEGFVVLA